MVVLTAVEEQLVSEQERQDAQVPPHSSIVSPTECQDADEESIFSNHSETTKMSSTLQNLSGRVSTMRALFNKTEDDRKISIPNKYGANKIPLSTSDKMSNASLYKDPIEVHKNRSTKENFVEKDYSSNDTERDIQEGADTDRVNEMQYKLNISYPDDEDKIPGALNEERASLDEGKSNEVISDDRSASFASNIDDFDDDPTLKQEDDQSGEPDTPVRINATSPVSIAFSEPSAPSIAHTDLISNVHRSKSHQTKKYEKMPKKKLGAQRNSSDMDITPPRSNNSFDDVSNDATSHSSFSSFARGHDGVDKSIWNAFFDLFDPRSEFDNETVYTLSETMSRSYDESITIATDSQTGSRPIGSKKTVQRPKSKKPHFDPVCDSSMINETWRYVVDKSSMCHIPSDTEFCTRDETKPSSSLLEKIESASHFSDETISKASRSVKSAATYMENALIEFKAMVQKSGRSAALRDLKDQFPDVYKMLRSKYEEAVKGREVASSKKPVDMEPPLEEQAGPEPPLENTENTDSILDEQQSQQDLIADLPKSQKDIVDLKTDGPFTESTEDHSKTPDTSLNTSNSEAFSPDTDWTAFDNSPFEVSSPKVDNEMPIYARRLQRANVSMSHVPVTLSRDQSLPHSLKENEVTMYDSPLRRAESVPTKSVSVVPSAGSTISYSPGKSDFTEISEIKGTEKIHQLEAKLDPVLMVKSLSTASEKASDFYGKSSIDFDLFENEEYSVRRLEM